MQGEFWLVKANMEISSLEDLFDDLADFQLFSLDVPVLPFGGVRADKLDEKNSSFVGVFWD